MYPEVDVVVNGEGELTFRDLLRASLDGRPPSALDAITGISFQGPDGPSVTTLAAGGSRISTSSRRRS